MTALTLKLLESKREMNDSTEDHSQLTSDILKMLLVLSQEVLGPPGTVGEPAERILPAGAVRSSWPSELHHLVEPRDQLEHLFSS